MKKMLLIGTLILALVVTALPVFADSSQSILSKITGISDEKIAEYRTQGIGYGQLIPASIIAKKADMDLDDVFKLRSAGKSYYTIATENGIKEDDYKNDLLDKRNDYVDEQVKAGVITAEQGKLIKERMAANIESCNGLTPGAGRLNGGCGMGGGFGRSGNGGGFGRGRLGSQGFGFRTTTTQ